MTDCMVNHTTALADIVSVIEGLCQEAGVDELVRPGPKAEYPISLFLTILILKNLFGESSESGFLRYLDHHHAALFPVLPEHSWFNRKAKKLGDQERRIHQTLLDKLGADRITIRIVDATVVPVVKYHRARRCRSFERKTEVNFGYCAAKDTYYYGEKLTVSMTPDGLPSASFILTPANVHDVRAIKEHVGEMAYDLAGKRVIGDKGYCDGELRETLRVDYQSRLVVPDKRGQQERTTLRDKKLLTGRKIIETVFEQMQDHMNLDATRAKSHKGLRSRIQSILLSFTFGAYYNMINGRSLLALKSIVT